MIIAGFAGTGKSTFAAWVENAIDLTSMPFSRILPAVKSGEPEAEKAAPWLLNDPLYPDNYVAAVLRAERRYDYVIIPTSEWVIYRLQKEYGRRIVVCAPTDECREEYRRRFVDRGNSEDFIEVFIGKWEEILSNVRELDNVVHIPLGPGEHLTDIREKLDIERASDATRPVSEQVVEQLEKEVREGGKGYVLYISGWKDTCHYRIPDLCDPAERSFLYGVGRELWELGLSRIVEEAFIFERLDREFEVEFVGREGLAEFLDRERAIQKAQGVKL